MIDERQMEERHYSVYVLISPENKYYVGMTGIDPKKRWKNGKGYRKQPSFDAIIEKFGWENFQHEVIASHLLKEEAMNFERLLIRELKQDQPEHGYNYAPGGLGNTSNGERAYWYGKHLSDEAKAKISKVHLGKSTPMLGKKQSEETREKLKANWKATHQNNGMARKVQCVETGETFKSVNEASRALNVCTQSIKKAASKGTATINGYHLVFISEPRCAKVAVRCVDTNVVYPSIKAAAEAYGGCGPVISMALKNGRKAFGVSWERVKED